MTQTLKGIMDHDDRMDAIEEAFRATRGGREYQVSMTFYAARRFAGYTGTSYSEAVATLATKYRTADEIAALPRNAAFARS
jgi:hypothetical protein